MPESQQNSEEKTFAISSQYLPEFSRGPHNQLSPRVWTAGEGQKDTRSMELPRGRFHGVRRDIRLALLLRDLSDNRFTGYSRILHNKGHMVIVLEEGTIILAKYQGISGDAALDAIFVSQELVVDAELNLLNASQIKLALEFNPDSIVRENLFIDPCRYFWKTSPTDETCQPDSSDRESSIPEPFTYFVDSSLSLRTKDQVEKDPGQERIIAFELLTGNSVLFEARQDVRKGMKKDVPDLSELWRSMGATSRENFSV